ncbi:putative multidrug resistance ABC transporter ATP-binding/permease protein YheI [Lachnospiraceae bacterium]|nr:putative multidrug resistance ABC transporter ATP-binding/permease protein YheI [Lachnospiraceae bacterium]
MLLLALISAFVSVAELFLVKLVIDFVISDAFCVSLLFIYLTMYFFFMAFTRIFKNILVGGYINQFEVKLKNQTMPEIYQKVLKIDFIEYNDEKFYDKLNRALTESDSRYFIILMQLFTFCVSTIIFFCVFAIYNNAVILIAVAINVAIYILYYFVENKKKYEFDKKEEAFFRFEDYMNKVFSLEEYAYELRANEGIKEKLFDKYSEYTNRYIEKYKVYLERFLFRSTLMTSLSYLIYWASSVYIAGLLIKARISLGDFLVLLNVVACMSTQMINVLKIIPDIYKSSLYIDDIKEILNYPCPLSNCDYGKTLESFEVLEFKNVFFRYGKELPYVLQNISFSIEKNEIIAIAGLNGAGKTTLLDCALGLIQPDKGHVEFNGVEYNKYNLDDLKTKFSIVFQDYQIYEITIAENILMHPINSTEDETVVLEALKYVNLYEKIISLEKGIHTLISSNKDESNFSYGERQKIVIARAYARKSPIIIFDEPTSSLDVYATNEFYESLLQMGKYQNRTIVFTTHKLHYVIHADKILFLEDGLLKETGNHNSLMALNGKYASLYRLQTEEFFAK